MTTARSGNTDHARAAAALLPELVALRRAIHAEPELGLHTPRTAARVRAALAGVPLEWRESRRSSGLVAVLHGAAPGRRLVLRGDMDALPLHEETGLPFASTVAGAMHACGHDSHTAMLVGAARLLGGVRDRLVGTVLFMFQPGEEGHHGARVMLEEGLLDPLPDAAFALHVLPNHPHGVVASRPGPLLASADRIAIVVRGRGGHASMPHDAADPVPVACELVLAIQSFVTRRVPAFEPAVVTIGQVAAGTTDNVIPETATLTGTIRTVSPRVRDRVHEGLLRLADGIATAHGLSAAVEIEPGFPVTVCDPRAVTFGRTVVESLWGPTAWRTLETPIMGAEDFSYVLAKVPGAMFFLGASAAEADYSRQPGLHSNRMVLDETVMVRGAALHAALAERFLAGGFAA